MKLTDYIASFLAERGVTHAFGMSGGAAVHLFDSIDRHSRMRIVSMTHEQCAAMAADGYARASGRLGVAVTTSGPGATNLLTGTCCSFYDSVPTLMLTGQVATHRLKGARQVRQVGFQETDVVSIFSPVTKYAVQITEASSIRHHLEKAFYLAFEGRPGPVLI
ncbi:MAG: thiamine pyrophosphate-binding protein, partial [Opitutaceae bacterium]